MSFDAAVPPRAAVPLMGTAALIRMAFTGANLQQVASDLMGRAAADEADANALLDLATVLLLCNLNEVGEKVQAHALALRRCYRLEPKHPAKLRLLAVMVPGDLMANAPLPFLFEESDILLTIVFVYPDEDLPEELPEHDLVFVAVSQSERTHALLGRLAEGLARARRAVVNSPRGIALTCRAHAFRVLQGVPGLLMPPTRRTSRTRLCQALRSATEVTAEEDMAFPWLIRPVDSHAGHGLATVAGAAELRDYLAVHASEDLYVSPFVDYRSADGLFRKYRVVLIDGTAFAAHMGISSHWMIHYLNAGMAESAAKREEERAFMETFSAEFAVRHKDALAAVGERFGLEYLVIDCAETRAGELLVFEVDPGSVMHSMDPDELFPYKRPTMARIYAAFRAMLITRAARRPV